MPSIQRAWIRETPMTRSSAAVLVRCTNKSAVSPRRRQCRESSSTSG